MRPKSACIVCRDRRRKCIRSHQGLTCDFCIARNLQCRLSREEEYQDDGYDTMQPRGAQLPSHKSSLLPPTDLCLELIDLYFRYVHTVYHVLFHRPSFIEAYSAGHLPKILLFAAMGMSARFSEHPSIASLPPRERGRHFTKEAERLLNLHDCSLTTIQASVILGQSAVVEGEGITESVYFSIACRMMILLDLPNAPARSRIQQEVRFRVWWSLFDTDTWSAVGVRQAKVLHLRNVPLPMAEHDFLALVATDPPLNVDHITDCDHVWPGPEMLTDSLLAWNGLVNHIFTQIDDVNTRAVAGQIRGFELLHAVEVVMNRLDTWRASLPLNMLYNHENLAFWTRSGFGSVFVFMHFNYHYLNLLLFYQFLHGSSDLQTPQANAHYASKCRQAATDVCNLIHLSSESTETELRNSIVGHVLTIASTVQLHILLFSSDEDDIRNAHYLLERNYDRLLYLQKYWPCIDISFSRFHSFHKACLRSQDDSHFRMDQWMLKFMLEFAASMTDRAEDDHSDSGWQQPWSQIRKDT